MRLAVRFFDGSLVPAIMLSAIGDRIIRASVPGCDDAVQFRCNGGNWFDEAGNIVQIQFGIPEEAFGKLVQGTTGFSENRSDGGEIDIWWACVRTQSSVLRVD